LEEYKRGDKRRKDEKMDLQQAWREMDKMDLQRALRVMTRWISSGLEMRWTPTGLEKD
jgi:hypothetical protein